MITVGDLVTYLRLDKKKFDQGLDQASKQAKSFGSGIAESLKQSFSFAIGGIIERGLANITAGIRNAASSAFDSVASYEGLTLSLEALIARQLRAGDSSIKMADALAVATGMTQQLLGWAQKLAIQSPFEDEDINKVVQLASSYRFGVQQTKQLTQSLVDAGAAGNATGAQLEAATRALGQMNLKGKVSAEELNQLNEAGFGFASTLERLGVTLDDVAAGSVSATEFISAFIQQMAEESEGAAQRTMNSWTGLISTLTSMISTGLREFTTGLLEPLRPLLEALGNAASADGLRESLRSLGEIAGNLVAPAIEWLTGQLEGLPAFFERAAGFIQQFRDEMAGLTVGDILAGLPGQLDQIQANLTQTLDTLSRAHEGTLANLQGQIDKAGEAMGQKMAEIAEKYAPRIQEIQERTAKAIADIQERIADSIERFNEETTERAEEHAKRRADIEKQIGKALETQEERLTELKRDHARKRRELATDLLTAETEEQYLGIQAQIKAEDERYKEQVAKTKEATGDQVAELQARLDEEDKQYAKEEAKRNKRHADELADLREAIAEQEAERDKQLAKVIADRAKEEAEVKASYDRQVADLQARIDQENQLYAQAVEEQKALAAEAMAETQGSMEQRAAALGQGPAAAVAGWVNWLRDGFNELSTSVSNFITQYATPLKGVLLGIGAVILGGGILAGLSALAGLLSGISAPILAIVAAVAVLYTAWTQNWGGIQEKTAAALAFLQPYWEQLKGIFGNFIDLLLPRLQEVWNTLTTQWTTVVAPALDRLWASVQKLADKLGISIDKSTVMESILWLVKAALAAVLLAVEGLNPIIDGFSLALATALGIVDGFVTSLGTLKDAWGAIGGVVDGLIAKFGEFGEAAKAAWDLIPPQWKPGSPTPFETGLRGIADALNKMPDLGQVFAPPEIQAGSLAGAVSSPTIYLNQTNHLPTAPAGFDAAGLLNQVDQRTEQLILKMMAALYNG